MSFEKGPLDMAEANYYEISMADHCNITQNCDIGTGQITFTDTGTFTCNAEITTSNLQPPQTNQIININNSCIIRIG